MRAWVALAVGLVMAGGASAQTAGLSVTADLRFTVENTTSQPIREVLASSSRAGAWGENLLAAPVAPGAAVELRPAGPDCRIDILIALEGGQEEQRNKVDGCAAPVLRVGQPIPPTDDPSFEFINGLPQAAQELYVAPTGQLATAFDLLITGPLAPRAATWVSLPPSGGCLQDVAVVYADGIRREWSLVDTCSIRDLTFR